MTTTHHCLGINRSKPLTYLQCAKSQGITSTMCGAGRVRRGTEPGDIPRHGSRGGALFPSTDRAAVGRRCSAGVRGLVWPWRQGASFSGRSPTIVQTKSSSANQ
jgi:hypothetical protein